jgi:hypothetical protein
MPADATLVSGAAEEAGPAGWVPRSVEGPSSTAGTCDGRPVRIYADGAVWKPPLLPSRLVCHHLEQNSQFDGFAGIFDLFHFGHARALEQAKKLCALHPAHIPAHPTVGQPC